MALSSGTRSFLGEIATWGAAAAILVAGAFNYDTMRLIVSDALGISETISMSDAEPVAAGTPTPKGGTEELLAGNDGHYYAKAEVNGREIGVMVDTGATMVALTFEDAERAGLHLRPSDFTARVSTANGTAAVAPVTLDRVTIGRITVRNIRAAVSERGHLEHTLLGMTFLSRLERVDIRQGRLLLVE